MNRKKNLLFCTVLVIAAQILSPVVAAETFIYSGGCFWCTEADSEKLDGVSEVISGFTGGTTPNPRYHIGEWGDHREAAQVIYNPADVSFEDLVRHVYETIDYEDNKGQFCDRGESYKPVIFTSNEEQNDEAKASKEIISKHFIHFCV